MKTLKKCIAILSAVTMLATSTPMVFAAKTSPAEGVNTQIGYNNYDSMTDSTNPDKYNGTPWINKLSDGTVTAMTGDTAHPYAVKLNVNDKGAFQNWHNTFHNAYDGTHEEPNVYSASAMIKMPEGNKAGYEFNLLYAKNDGTESGYKFNFTLQKDGKLTSGKEGVEVVNNITLTPDAWHKLSIVCDRPNKTVKVYIDGTQAFNYVVNDISIEHFLTSVSINNYGSLNGEGASSAESGLYMDDLSLDKVVDGAFYGSAVVNDNNITVTLSEDPGAGALATNAISVKKADGTAVTTGAITVSEKTITIPITREMATEYVVCLPADLTSTSGNKIYSPEIFVNSGIKSTDKIVVIDENFEGGTYKWGYTNGAYITDGVLPTYFKGTEAEGNPKRYLYARTAYKNDTDGTVADVAPADWANVSKVLAVQQTGTTDTGVWIEFPRTIVDDWTMEFDFMMNGIGNAENIVAKKDAVGWALCPIAGDKNINVANSTVTYSGGTTGSQTLMPIFGMTAGKKLGEPNWTSKDGDLYWSSSQGSTDYLGTQREAMDINKWYHVKLDFNAGSYTATKCKATVTTSDDQSFLNGEWNLPIGMNHNTEWGYQFNGVMFKMPVYAGMNTMYLDNVKVTTQNLTDHKVKTVTLTDMENEEFGAVSQASDMVTKAKIDFTTGKGTNVIDPTTVNPDTIKVTDSDGNPVEFTLGGYNASTTSVELTFNKMLTVGKTYTLTVKGVKAQEYAAPYGKGKNMFELLPYTAQINVVDRGEYKVVAFEIVDAEGNPVNTLTTGEVNIEATIKNTSGKDESFDMILASYDKTTKAFKNVSRETKTAENGTYENGTYKKYTLETDLSVDAATDAVKGFLWEGMNSLRPLTTGISK